MYLKQIWLENTGPLNTLDIKMPFSEEGNPKPLVLVGSNGAGKTVTLSYIADALVEIAKKVYQDVLPGQGYNSPYLRVISAQNHKTNTTYSVAGLLFDIKKDDGSIYQVSYCEQSGTTAPANWEGLSQKYFKQNIPWSAPDKLIFGNDNDVIKKDLIKTSNCFFPFSRFERPNWQNSETDILVDSFNTGENFQNKIGSRPLIVNESHLKNQNWLLHLFLDSRAEFDVLFNNGGLQIQVKEIGDVLSSLRYRSGLDNVAKILQSILKKPNVSLGISSRNSGIGRIFIKDENRVLIPSLQNLSAGQSILFNTFLTIIRYSDHSNLDSVLNLNQISGIISIDEIDAHMHADLQYDVLPKLIKLFPKIQFVITSHSPLFVLGMEKEFGSDGYLLLEMPEGNAITAERFSEFKKSFDYYQETKYFDDELRINLEKTLKDQSKPMVLTEGDTDVDYLKTALYLYERNDLLSAIDIEWVGANRNGRQFHSGYTSLNSTGEFLRANPKFMQYRRIMLLYDCDTNKPASEEGNLWIRTVPYNNDNKKIKKGIENSLDETLFDSENTTFYSKNIQMGEYGESKIITTFNKRVFCNYICNERRIKDDFKAFDSIITMFEELLS